MSRRTKSSRQHRASRSSGLRALSPEPEPIRKRGADFDDVRAIARFIGEPRSATDFDYDAQQHTLILDPFESGGEAQHVLPMDQIMKDPFMHHESAFSRVGQPEAEAMFEGYDVTMLLLGFDPTTMMYGRSWPLPGDDDHSRGWVIRMMQYLFDKLGKDPHVRDHSFEVQAYQVVPRPDGGLHDLQNDATDADAKTVRVRTARGKITLENLKKTRCRNMTEFRALLEKLIENRLTFTIDNWGSWTPIRVIHIRLNRQAEHFKISSLLTLIVMEQVPAVRFSQLSGPVMDHFTANKVARSKFGECLKMMSEVRRIPFRDHPLTHALSEIMMRPSKMTCYVIGYGGDRGPQHRMPTEQEMELLEYVLWVRAFTQRQKKRNMDIVGNTYLEKALPVYRKRLEDLFKQHNRRLLPKLEELIEENKEDLHGFYRKACLKFNVPEEPALEAKDMFEDSELHAMQRTVEPPKPVIVPIEFVVKEIYKEMKAGLIKGPRERQLRELFNTAWLAYDTNKDEQLDAEELRHLLEEYLKVTRSLVSHEIRRFQLEMTYLAGFMGVRLGEVVRESEAPTLAVMDTLMSELETNGDKILPLLLKRLDKDQDGVVNREDFFATVPDLMFGDQFPMEVFGTEVAEACGQPKCPVM